MKLASLVGYKTEGELYITPRHEDYMRDFDGTYSSSSLAFMSEQLSKPDRDRTKSFSASGLGDCRRKQQFGYEGLPQAGITTEAQGIFANGDFMHLRWQMLGMDAGWLNEAEVAVPDNELGLRGTMDGVCADGSVFEAKSINSNGFRSVMSFGAKPMHEFQVGTYMYATGRETARILYENKDTQEYKEIYVRRTADLMRQVKDQAEQLNEATEAKKLLPMLEDCVDKKGFAYNFCPYKKLCPTIKDYEDLVTKRG